MGKVSDAPAAGTIPLGVAARLIMVSERHVQRLAASGWIEKPYTVPGVVQGYIRWLQDDNRKATKLSGEEDVRSERARKLKMENDENERQLVRTDDALAAIDHIRGIVCSGLAAIPARATDDLALRRRIEGAVDDVLAGIDARHDAACEALRAGGDPFEQPINGVGPVKRLAGL
jgi:hypothetical protein